MTVYMYNPCKTCGGVDFALFRSTTLHNGVEPDTRCIGCTRCKRFGSVDNWNKVNPKGAA